MRSSHWQRGAAASERLKDLDPTTVWNLVTEVYSKTFSAVAGSPLNLSSDEPYSAYIKRASAVSYEGTSTGAEPKEPD